MSNHSATIGNEVDKLIAKSNFIEESISTQVNQLEGISDNVFSTLKDIEVFMENSSSNIESKSIDTINAMQNLVSNTTECGNIISVISDKSVSEINVIYNDLQNKNEDLQRLSDSIVLSFKLLTQELGSSSMSMQEQVSVATDRLEEVGSVIKKHTDSLNEATSVVVAQSKVGETAIAQQQKNIMNSVAKIEEIKAELKYQIDELTSASTQMTQEAEITISQLKKQMIDTIDNCNLVVYRKSVG